MSLPADAVIAQRQEEAPPVRKVQLRLNVGARLPLPAGTRLAVLVRQTPLRDNRGSWARIRIRKGVDERLPEAYPPGERPFRLHFDELTAGGYTGDAYPLTSATQNVYFIYALTPADLLYETVAWSTTRRRFESAFERFSEGALVNVRKITDDERDADVRRLFFEAGIAEDTDVAELFQSNPPSQAPPDSFDEVPEGRPLTFEHVTFEGDQPTVHLLPAGTEMAVFTTRAGTLGEEGFEPVAVTPGVAPESDPESQRHKRTRLTSAGSAADLSYPDTDVSWPFAYLFYAKTPEGQLFESIQGEGAAFVIIDDSFVTMRPINDGNRIRAITEAFFVTEEERSAEAAFALPAWLLWALGALVLAGIGGGFALSRRRKAGQPRWGRTNQELESLKRAPIPSADAEAVETPSFLPPISATPPGPEPEPFEDSPAELTVSGPSMPEVHGLPPAMPAVDTKLSGVEASEEEADETPEDGRERTAPEISLADYAQTDYSPTDFASTDYAPPPLSESDFSEHGDAGAPDPASIDEEPFIMSGFDGDAFDGDPLDAPLPDLAPPPDLNPRPGESAQGTTLLRADQPASVSTTPMPSTLTEKDVEQVAKALARFVEDDNAFFNKYVSPHISEDDELHHRLLAYRRYLRKRIEQMMLGE